MTRKGHIKARSSALQESGKQHAVSISRNSPLQQVFDKLYEPQIPSSSGRDNAALCHHVHRVAGKRGFSRSQPCCRSYDQTQTFSGCYQSRQVDPAKEPGWSDRGSRSKAKPIIDKYVDDRQAANGDRAKLVSLKTKYDSDINAILTPDQQTKLAQRRAPPSRK